jgi:cupin 2 domain-containing protein
MSEAGAKRYTLWRQDDNGQQFRIAAFSRRASAEERMRELQGGGHKQMYWIETTAPPDLRLGNLYRNIPDNLPQELIEPLLHSDQLRVERIVSRQHASAEGAWYDQPEDEWVLLVAGRARLEFADPAASLDLKAGDYLLIPAHCRHRVAMTDSQRDSIWLALHLKPGTAR